MHTKTISQGSANFDADVLALQFQTARLADQLRAAGECPRCEDAEIWRRAERRILKHAVRRGWLRRTA